MLSYFTMQKFIAVSCGSELTARIDGILSTVRERIDGALSIQTNANLVALSKAEAEGSAIGITADDVESFEQSFFALRDTVSIALSGAIGEMKKSLGDVSSSVGVVESDVSEGKHDFESGASELTVDTSDAATEENKFAAFDAELPVDALIDIIYQYALSIHNAYAIACEIASIEIHGSLGNGSNALAIENPDLEVAKRVADTVTNELLLNAQDAELSKRAFEEVLDVIGIQSSDADIFYQFLTGAESAISMTSSITDTLLTCALGDLPDEIAIGTYEDGNSVVVFVGLSDAVSLFCDMASSLIVSSGAAGEVSMTTEASSDLKRYRRWEEVDNLTLADIDGMTLNELYYVELTS